MNKIFNWTFGGFFRTIGRTLAFLLLGCIFGYIAFKNGIKITDLLGISSVRASTVTNWSSIESRIWYDQQGTNTAGSWSSGSTHTFSPSYPVTSIQWRVKTSGGLSNENTYTFTFGYTPTPDAISVNNVYIRREGDYPNETITCKEWQRNSSTGRYTKECTFTPGYNYSSSDYLFIRIMFNESYITSIQSYISGYNERESTNAVITDQTNNIINNNNQNTQDIINNQNTNTQAQIDANKVCISYDKKDIKQHHAYLSSNATVLEVSTSTMGITDYIKIDNKTELTTLSTYSQNYNIYSCFYNINKSYISCIKNQDLPTNITIPTNAEYVRFSIDEIQNLPQIKICKNGNQALQDSINDDNVSGANDKAKDLFTNFTTNNHGLTGVISAPLDLIRNLASKTCSSLVLPLPFVNENLTLPCLSAIYQQHFPTFLTMYQVILTAIIGYKICISIFFMVKGFKDPNEDKIEVLDL